MWNRIAARATVEIMSTRSLLATLCLVLCGGAGSAAPPIDAPALRAEIRARTRSVSVGKPVWVEFTLQNVSDEPTRLVAPGADEGASEQEMGLPLSHVFSGKGFAGLTVESEWGRTWETPIEYNPPASVPALTLAPHCSIGSEVEVTKYYPVLITPGRYRLQWKPYDGLLSSNVLLVEIAPRKQAIIQTDHGEMTVQFFYEDAPETIANFIELARSGFYNGLTFHRIWPGHFILGGDPAGDGTGIRPDGKKIPAEFSNRPQSRGTVDMALIEDDPDSASCQFFICNTRMPSWDGRYTAFGELVGDASFETLEKLMSIPTDEQGHPKKSIFIRSIRIVNVPTERQ